MKAPFKKTKQRRLDSEKGKGKRAAILWTGGKDSSLALYWAQRMGYSVEKLVTFAPPDPVFLAHPLRFIFLQAQAMKLHHRIMPISGKDRTSYRQSYIAAIRHLKETKGIDVLITGDMAEVAGEPNWIRECCQGLKMEIQTPLWGTERDVWLSLLLADGFHVIFSCVKEPWLTSRWAGRLLDAGSLDELRRVSEKTGMDLCGEQGEYHTLVVDGPMFSKRIYIGDYTRKRLGPMTYLEIGDLTLREKS